MDQSLVVGLVAGRQALLERQTFILFRALLGSGGQVPAEVGRRVIAYGKPGIILADRGHYIGVVLDEDPKKRIRNYHPAWEMQYGEMAKELPLKNVEVLTNGLYDWDDVKYMLGDRTTTCGACGQPLVARPSTGHIKSCLSASTTTLRFKVRAAA